MSYGMIIHLEAELEIEDAFEWYEAQTSELGHITFWELLQEQWKPSLNFLPPISFSREETMLSKF